MILRRDLNLTSQAVAGPIPRDENADVLSAFHELKTYAQEIPSLLRFNEVHRTRHAGIVCWERLA